MIKIKNRNVVVDSIFVLSSWALIYVLYGLYFGSSRNIFLYTSVYLLVYLVVFGLRYTLQKKWINFLPLFTIMAGLVFFLIYILFTSSSSDLFMLMLSLSLFGFMLICFSYFLSSLLEKVFIENTQIDFIKQLNAGYTIVLAPLSMIIWIVFFILLTGRHGNWYIPWTTYLLLTSLSAGVTGCLMSLIYIILRRKYRIVLISLVFTLLCILIYFLISFHLIITIVMMGIILWLGLSAIGSLIYKIKH